MPDAGKRNILERNLFRLERVSNCSAAWSRTRPKEQCLSPKPKYGPAILPCYERQRRRDARQPPFRLDRISAGSLLGPLEVAPRFPGLESAAQLREDLEATQRLFDPSGRAVASHHVVVVAHSMGGLLAHTLVSDSGTALWNVFATKPLNSLKLSPD